MGKKIVEKAKNSIIEVTEPEEEEEEEKEEDIPKFIQLIL
jgi:hypothetical protein